MGFTEKSYFQGEASRKTNIEGGDCLKGGAWSVYWFKGRLGKKKGGGVFEGGGGWDSNAHIVMAPPTLVPSGIF